MRNKVIKNYINIIIVLFIIINVLLDSLYIEGLLYQIIMCIFVIMNLFFLIKNRYEINDVSLNVALSLIISTFSNDIPQFIFIISNALLLIIIKHKNSNRIRVVSLITTILAVGSIMILPYIGFRLILIRGDYNEYGIYDDTRYICKNGKEAFAYSAGAMDKYHFNISTYFDIIDIDNVIKIYYRSGIRNEVSQEQYEKYIKGHNCILVGDEDGDK